MLKKQIEPADDATVSGTRGEAGTVTDDQFGSLEKKFKALRKHVNRKFGALTADVSALREHVDQKFGNQNSIFDAKIVPLRWMLGVLAAFMGLAVGILGLLAAFLFFLFQEVSALRQASTQQEAAAVAEPAEAATTSPVAVAPGTDPPPESP